VNRDDLMNALSGLDPKYIDEAAFELHGKTVSFPDVKKTRAKKAFFIALPAAAAALLFIGIAVILPTMDRLNKSESASAPAYSESAAEAPADFESAAEAPAYEAEPAAEEAKDYEAAEEAAPADDLAETDAEAPVFEASETEEAAEAAGPVQAFTLESATFSDGILTVEISGTLPTPFDAIKYAITGTDDGGMKQTIAEGMLDEIMIETDPLMLDLAGQNLAGGTYTLTIDEESIDFTIP